jgi:hypothetical protein
MKMQIGIKRKVRFRKRKKNKYTDGTTARQKFEMTNIIIVGEEKIGNKIYKSIKNLFKDNKRIEIT